jgi:hypothetical protein
MTSIMTTNENGDMEWWVNGLRHREGGLPAVEMEDGEKEWWVNGERHYPDRWTSTTNNSSYGGEFMCHFA